jgi:Protein of unknown function (DUF3168)
MSIDVEALVSRFLRAQTTVTDLTGDRVYTDMPHQRAYPLVLITRTGGTALYRNWLEAVDLDLTAHADTHKQAYTTAQTCLSALTSALVGAHTEGVVTKVRAESTAYAPEPDSADPQGHARPRYTVSVTVTAHP